MSANLVHMAEAFNTTVAALEDELAQLVLDGHIQARIDSRTKVRHCFFRYLLLALYFMMQEG